MSRRFSHPGALRMLRANVLLSLTVLMPLALHAQTQTVRDTRAIALARLDAAVHYFSPISVAHASRWDSVFAQHVQPALDARTTTEYRDHVTALLRDGLEDALSDVERASTTRWALTMQQGVGVIAPESGRPTTKPVVAPSMPIVIDLRGGARLTDDALAQLIGVGPIPAQRALSYQGLPPAMMQTSGNYQIVWREALRFNTKADSARVQRNIVVLTDDRSVVPSSLFVGLYNGRVRFVSTSTRPVVVDGVTHAVDMGDGVRALVRLSKTDYFGVAVHADTTVTAADALTAAMSFAQSIARNSAVPAKRDSASYRPVLAGLATVRLPINQRPAFTAPYPAAGYRLLAAMRTWSTYATFSPYTHRFENPWTTVLTKALPRVENATNALEYGLAIATIVKSTNDSHSAYFSPAMASEFSPQNPVPFATQFVEGKLVVTRLAPMVRDSTQLRRGDEIVRIDGVTVDSLRRKLSPYIATSTPQSLDYAMALRVVGGTPGSVSTFTVRGANGTERDVRIARLTTFDRAQTARRGGGVIRMLPDNIGYVDMERLPQNLVDSVFTALGNAKGIIFDMRGYPQGTGFTISPRLTTANPLTAVAHFDRPDRPSPDSATFTTYPFDQVFNVSPRSKYLGRTAMLIDEHAISQSEHSALMFKSLANTTMVGSPTTGANGDVTDVVMPGGVRFYMTGQSVKWPDGRALQGVGVQPDVPVRPTIAGLRAQTDEVLTAAFHHLGGKGDIPFEENAALETLPGVALRALPNEPTASGWRLPMVEAYRIGIDTTIDGPIAGAPRGSLHVTFRGSEPSGVSMASQQVNAESWRGKRVSLRGWVRTRGVSANGAEGIGLWLRIDCADGQFVLDNMQERIVGGTAGWQQVVITLDVPSTAVGFSLGGLFRGSGEAWIDELTLEATPSAPVTRSVQSRVTQAQMDGMLNSYRTAPATIVNPSFKFGTP